MGPGRPRRARPPLNGTLTLTPNPTLASPGSPFSPLNPFIPGRPWGEHGGGTAGSWPALWPQLASRTPPGVWPTPSLAPPQPSAQQLLSTHRASGGVSPSGPELPMSRAGAPGPCPRELCALRLGCPGQDNGKGAGHSLRPGPLPAAPTGDPRSLPAAQGSQSLPCAQAVRMDPVERKRPV